jgi:hypothetical protein
MVTSKQIISKILEEYARSPSAYSTQVVAGIIYDIAISDERNTAKYNSKSSIRELLMQAQKVKTQGNAHIEDVPELTGKTRGQPDEESRRRLERDAISSTGAGGAGIG